MGIGDRWLQHRPVPSRDYRPERGPSASGDVDVGWEET